MNFTLEQIDRGIEWHLNDEMISLGLLPDKRAFLAANDISGYEVAYEALAKKVKIFGVGNYRDREQLRANNIIITRLDIPDGEIGFGDGTYFKYNSLKGKYDKIYSGEGTNHVQYEVRFVCDNVELERILSTAMLKLFPRKQNIYGIVDETLKKTDENFLVTKPSPIVDISASTFIEKVVRIIVNDVNLFPEELIEEVVPVTEINIYATPNIELEDQDPSLWDSDPETGHVKIEMPLLQTTTVESADAADILLNFDKEISIKNESEGLRFQIFKDTVEVTDDILSFTKQSALQLIITMGTNFVSGEAITISYAREEHEEPTGGSVVGSQNIEIETLEGKVVTNNL